MLSVINAGCHLGSVSQISLMLSVIMLNAVVPRLLIQLFLNNKIKIFLESHITQQFLIFFRIIFEVFCRFIMQGTQSLARMLRVVKNMAA